MLPKHSTKKFLVSRQEQRAELVFVHNAHLCDQDAYVLPILNLEGLRVYGTWIQQMCTK